MKSLLVFPIPSLSGVLRALLLFALVATSSAAAQKTPLSVDKGKLHSIAFSNLVVRVKGQEWIGIGDDQLKVHLVEHLRTRGYPALGAESLVFNRDDSDKARTLLGGTVVELDCAKGTRCRIGITWEVFDKAQDGVVYSVLTRFSSMSLDLRTEDSRRRAGQKLVLGALDSLLSRPGFVAALTKHDGPSEHEQAAGPMVEFRDCTAPSRVMPAAAEEILGATVLVETSTGFGSGTVISPDGIILTAAHVVSDRTDLKVKTRAGVSVPAVVVRLHKQQDVAILFAQLPPDVACVALRSDAPKAGEEVYAIGSPASRELAFTLTRGIISGTPEIEHVRYLQTDASVNPGNSGGPMVDAAGRVIGVVSWKIAGGNIEGIAFGVPVEAVERALAVKAGAQTSGELRVPLVAAPESPPKVVQDSPDPEIRLDPEGDRQREAKAAAQRLRDARDRATPRYVKVLKRGGAVLAGLGVAFAAGSFIAFDDDTKYEKYKELRVYNDVGWVLIATGTVALTTGLFLTPSLKDIGSEKAPQSSKIQVQGRVGLGHGVLQLRF